MSRRTIMVKEPHLDNFLFMVALLYQMTKDGFDQAVANMSAKRRMMKDGKIVRYMLQFIAGHYYHITHHMAEQLLFVTDDIELNIVLDALERFSQKYHIDVISYNIMSNHVHLIIRTSIKSRVSKFMQAFLSSSVQRINRKRLLEALAANPNLRVEPPKIRFEGRFKATLLLDTSYLQASIVYVFTNAEKAGIPDNLNGVARHNWVAFKKNYRNDKQIAPGDAPFCDVMKGIEEYYIARRDYWIAKRGVNSQQQILPSLRLKRLQAAMDEVSSDLIDSTPGWIRKRLNYDPELEIW